MTIQEHPHTRSGFDATAYARGFESWDIEGLLAHYADDLELTMITPENPPGRPLVHHGKQPLRAMWEQASSAGVRVSVRRSVVTDGAVAFTFDCVFPGHHVVVANVVADLVDGLIVRQHEVMVGGAAEELIAST